MARIRELAPGVGTIAATPSAWRSVSSFSFSFYPDFRSDRLMDVVREEQQHKTMKKMTIPGDAKDDQK
jgi:hypothetical protein